MAEINQFINYVELPNNDARGIQTYHNLTIGDQVFNGSSPVTITAANLGLSQALKFVGSTTDIMEDNQSNIPTGISTPSIGDVVLSDGNGEFVWLGENWEQLGSENSYALNTITITGTNGLTGGGTLIDNRTISIDYSNSVSPIMNGTTNVGTSIYPARSDHVHPSDTSKLSLSGGTMEGILTFGTSGKMVLSSAMYGTSDPPSGAVKGQIYFKLV